MLLQNKWLCIFLPLLLSGCGFEPLYAKKTNANDPSKLFAGVTVDPIRDRTGEMLKNALEDKLNPHGVIPPSPAYRLQVSYRSSIASIGVSRDATVSRYNVYLNSRYVLYRNVDGKAITSGEVNYVGSYNNLINEYFSTYISEQDAYKNGVEELSEQYRQRLSAYLDEGAPEEKVKVLTPEEEKANQAFSPPVFNPNGFEPARRP
jgi:LPS-assembly lipoprotein